MLPFILILSKKCLRKILYRKYRRFLIRYDYTVNAIGKISEYACRSRCKNRPSLKLARRKTGKRACAYPVRAAKKTDTPPSRARIFRRRQAKDTPKNSGYDRAKIRLYGTIRTPQSKVPTPQRKTPPRKKIKACLFSFFSTFFPFVF